MKQLSVSVVIPVKNAERYLAQAIDSILAQTRQPQEIIVVDGNSTDESRSIAASYSHVRCIDQNGQGLADAWNTGIEAAQSDLIAFLDSDDLWTANKLEVQVNYLAHHTEVECLVARVKFFLEAGSSIPHGFRPELLEGDYIGHIPGNLVARKTLFDTFGKFDTELDLASDVEWFCQAKDQKISMDIIPEVLLHKRVHETNFSLSGSGPARSSHEILTILKRSVQHQRRAKMTQTA